MTTPDRLAILNAHTIAEAAAILGMTEGSVRVLRTRLKRAGQPVVALKVGRRRKAVESNQPTTQTVAA